MLTDLFVFDFLYTVKRIKDSHAVIFGGHFVVYVIEKNPDQGNPDQGNHISLPESFHV